MRSSPDDLRRAGWSVAVHNDYRLRGEPHTFWLFTHPDGRWAKGEGRTDQEALDEVRRSIGALRPGGAHPARVGDAVIRLPGKLRRPRRRTPRVRDQRHP